MLELEIKTCQRQTGAKKRWAGPERKGSGLWPGGDTGSVPLVRGFL